MATPNPQQQPAQQPAQGQHPQAAQAASLGIDPALWQQLFTTLGPILSQIFLGLFQHKSAIEAAAQQHAQGTQPKP